MYLKIAAYRTLKSRSSLECCIFQFHFQEGSKRLEGIARSFAHKATGPNKGLRGRPRNLLKSARIVDVVVEELAASLRTPVSALASN
jgi:hypothetical protein